MPLQRRLPKRGFKNINRVEYQPVNVRDLARVEPGVVTPESLKQSGLIRNLKKPVKILGTGEVEAAYQVSAHAFSGAARAKIEGAGGTVTVLSGVGPREAPADGVAREATETEEASVPQGDEAPEAEDEQA
jgi:large subunit ribosomal protein L15